jgi:hypothetical protein
MILMKFLLGKMDKRLLEKKKKRSGKKKRREI